VEREITIESGKAEAHYWADLWRFRELFGFLAWRDVLVRYKQTAIGVLWAVIRPLLTIVIGTGIFGGLAQLPSDGVPYSVLVCAGTLPWYFFASALTESSNSLVGNSNLISKIYFPRLILPASAVVVAFVDFAISFVILAGLMVWHGMMPTWRLLALPAFILLAFLSALGPGLLFTALNVKYRDFRYVIPFMVQFGLYLSPVGFSSAVIPEHLRLIYSLNPIVGVIDGFRWAILGGKTNVYIPGLVLSWLVIVFFLWVGVRQFRKMEKSFADLI
jgi:lipopolysaccharide transport system permease protein